MKRQRVLTLTIHLVEPGPGPDGDPVIVIETGICGPVPGVDPGDIQDALGAIVERLGDEIDQVWRAALSRNN